MAQISHLVRINATPRAVFERLATVDGIAGWFTRASSPDYRAGGRLQLYFSDEPISFVITTLDAPSRLVWHCTTPNDPWSDTDIAFELVEQPGRTVVRFDHLGWPAVTDRFRDCSMSWAYFLESLRMLVEEGRGTPESVAPPCEASQPS